MPFRERHHCLLDYLNGAYVEVILESISFSVKKHGGPLRSMNVLSPKYYSLSLCSSQFNFSKIFYSNFARTIVFPRVSIPKLCDGSIAL